MLGSEAGLNTQVSKSVDDSGLAKTGCSTAWSAKRVVVLLDDVGYGTSSTFGGPARTPELTSLRRKDSATTDTTALRSPTRAVL